MNEKLVKALGNLNLTADDMANILVKCNSKEEFITALKQQYKIELSSDDANELFMLYDKKTQIATQIDDEELCNITGGTAEAGIIDDVSNVVEDARMAV